MQDILTVLYQDDQLIVCVKPYGLLSEYDEKKPNLPALLKAEAGCDAVYTVHRLDRTTEGLMVYAKTEKAARRLSDLIQKGGVEKIYLAVVEGCPELPSGELADLLYFDRQKNKSYVVRRERRGVKQARLYYEVVDTAEHVGQTLSLLKIRLLTGRTHQIRVQFASRKMPLAGDRRYGSAVVCDNIALCACELSFAHPFTEEEMRFTYTPDDGLFGQFVERNNG